MGDKVCVALRTRPDVGEALYEYLPNGASAEPSFLMLTVFLRGDSFDFDEVSPVVSQAMETIWVSPGKLGRAVFMFSPWTEHKSDDDLFTAKGLETKISMFIDLSGNGGRVLRQEENFFVADLRDPVSAVSSPPLDPASSFSRPSASESSPRDNFEDHADFFDDLLLQLHQKFGNKK